jgi:hypothetical protein
MVNFVIGFLAGFFANWVFGLLSRVIPSTWVRFEVHFQHPKKDVDLAGESWLVPVTIFPPRWRRILMPPLQEYMLVDVQIDDMKWVRSKWIKGDLSETMLRADAAMTVPCTVLSRLGHSGSWYIADYAAEQDYLLEETPKNVRLRVLCSLDNRIANETVLVVKQDGGELVLNAPTEKR